MPKLYIVTSSTGKEPEEADSSVRVVGVYTDPDVALAVKSVAWGVGASVSELEVDVIDPELQRTMKILGLELPSSKNGIRTRIGCPIQIFSPGMWLRRYFSR